MTDNKKCCFWNKDALIQHLFIPCPFTKNFCNRLCEWFSIYCPKNSVKNSKNWWRELIGKINSKFLWVFALHFGLYGKYAMTLFLTNQELFFVGYHFVYWICMQSYLQPVEKWRAIYIGYTVWKWLHGIFTSGAAGGLTTEWKTC